MVRKSASFEDQENTWLFEWFPVMISSNKEADDVT